MRPFPLRVTGTAAALSMLVACTSMDTTGPASGTSPSAFAPSNWEVARDPQWLYEIRHPSSWNVGSLLVSHGDTRQWEMLSLGTYPLRAGGERCAHVPENALDDLGPTDAFLHIQRPEYVEGLGPRPRGTSIDFRTRADYAGEVSVFGCLRPRQDFRYAFVPFHDEGRNFLAFMAVGLDASDERRHELLGVFDSLRMLDAKEFRELQESEG